MNRKIIPILVLLLAVVVSCKVDKAENGAKGPNTEESVTTGAGFKISFNAVVEKDDSFQLFYNEDGTEAFDGDQMIELKLKGNAEPQNIEFVLPDAAKPLNLRFDIGSSRELKQVKFNNLSIDYKGKNFKAEGSNFFKYFYPNDQVVCDTVASVAKIITKPEQPYDPIIGGTLYLRTELEKLNK